MGEIEVAITRITDDSFPGWAECELYDAWGNKHVFHDKIPAFSSEVLTFNSAFPRKGVVRCVLCAEWVDGDGRSIVTVSTEKPDGVESADGVTRFDLLSSQVRFPVG